VTSVHAADRAHPAVLFDAEDRPAALELRAFDVDLASMGVAPGVVEPARPGAYSVALPACVARFSAELTERAVCRCWLSSSCKRRSSLEARQRIMTTSLLGAPPALRDPTLPGYLLDDVEGAPRSEPKKDGSSPEIQAKLAKLEELTKAGKLDPKKMEELTALAKQGKLDPKRLDELIQLLMAMGDDPEKIREALAAIGIGAPRKAPAVANPRAAPPPPGTVKASALPAALQMGTRPQPAAAPVQRPAWGGAAPGTDAMRAANGASAAESTPRARAAVANPDLKVPLVSPDDKKSIKESAQKLLEQHAQGKVRFWDGLSTGSELSKVQALARGEPAFVNATGGKAYPDANMMRALVEMAELPGGISINALTGGSHSSNSRHYVGKAVDLDVNTGNAAQIAAIAAKHGGSRNSEDDHIHLDFLSGYRRLSAASGARRATRARPEDSAVATSRLACGTACTSAPSSPEDAGATRDATSMPDAISQRDAGRTEVDAASPPDAAAPDAAAPDAAAEPRDLRLRLLDITGLDVEEIDAPIAGTRAFLLKLRQPEDHAAPEGKSFKQRLVLVHRGDDAPNVIHTTGYDLFGDPRQWAEYMTEPTEALEANQITVEHRFFGESIAADADWTKLDVEQSAGDSHQIVERLRAIYPGPWVGTGVSKGGMTTIFHYRFFPADLAAIVPYVAPISFDTSSGNPDPRYLDWVAQIGPADGVCRARVLDMEVELIERRSEVAAYLLMADPRVMGLRSDVLEVALTGGAFGFHWVFWQYYGSPTACGLLPARGGPIADLAAWFPFEPSSLVEPRHFDPGGSPYEYQVENELGAQAIDYTILSTVTASIDYSVLPDIPADPNPWGDAPSYDPAAMQAVDAFLRTQARHVLGIYGAWDPWSGGRITVDESRGNAVHVVAEHGHDAQLSQLPPEEQAQALALLRGWFGHRLRDASDDAQAAQRMFQRRDGQRRIIELVLERERQQRRIRRR